MMSPAKRARTPTPERSGAAAGKPATLPDYSLDDPAVRSLPREELAALQDERLRALVAYTRETSGFWRRKLDAAGEVRGVADLPALEPTTRAELDAEQAAHPPFGDYTCSPRETWMGMFTTSGTSGRKLKRVVSWRDWQMMIALLHRNPAPPPGEIFMLLGPIDGLLGPSVGVEAARERGSIPVLAGMWDTRTKVQAIAELRPGVIAGAASFGFEQIIDGYGLTEVWPLGGNCPLSRALHIPEDVVAVECIDPDTGAAVSEGEPGEIVLTTLVGDTHPLLRYRTRDVGRLIVGEPCACGSTFARIERIEGRTDDMIW
jgi:phenylacetate-CoA ligase